MLETDAPWCDVRRTHAGYSHVKTHVFEGAAKKPKSWAPGKMVKARNEPCALVQVFEIVHALIAPDMDADAFASQIYANTCSVFFPQ